MEIVPGSSLGFKARITFAADTAKAADTLRARGIAFTEENHDLHVSDPEGNEILLH